MAEFVCTACKTKYALSRRRFDGKTYTEVPADEFQLDEKAFCPGCRAARDDTKLRQTPREQ